MLRKKTGEETPLQTINRFAEHDSRFIVLRKVLRTIKFKPTDTSAIEVDRLNGACGLTLFELKSGYNFWLRRADINLAFKAGKFDHYVFADKDGKFNVRADDPQADVLLKIWMKDRTKYWIRVKKDKAEEAEKRRLFRESPKGIAREKARQFRKVVAEAERLASAGANMIAKAESMKQAALLE